MTDTLNFRTIGYFFFDKSNKRSIKLETAVTWSKSNLNMMNIYEESTLNFWICWFCLFIYLWIWLSLCKIVRSSVILLLPLYTKYRHWNLLFQIWISSKSLCDITITCKFIIFFSPKNKIVANFIQSVNNHCTASQRITKRR